MERVANLARKERRELRHCGFLLQEGGGKGAPTLLLTASPLSVFVIRSVRVWLTEANCTLEP